MGEPHRNDHNNDSPIPLPHTRPLQTYLSDLVINPTNISRSFRWNLAVTCFFFCLLFWFSFQNWHHSLAIYVAEGLEEHPDLTIAVVTLFSIQPLSQKAWHLSGTYQVANRDHHYQQQNIQTLSSQSRFGLGRDSITEQHILLRQKKTQQISRPNTGLLLSQRVLSVLIYSHTRTPPPLHTHTHTHTHAALNPLKRSPGHKRCIQPIHHSIPRRLILLQTSSTVSVQKLRTAF